jgi:hypothetical protein
MKFHRQLACAPAAKMSTVITDEATRRDILGAILSQAPNHGPSDLALLDEWVAKAPLAQILFDDL